ncbi:MAG: M56 family metallopeptidase [Pseudomonadota bacterium]|nr:M56 family metallopeptidase [Pseudomonadota bacterium]
MSASALISGIGWALLHFVWQGALIGCATAVALIAMRNAKPQQRYAVACAALLLCLTWPACELAARLSGGSAGGAGMQVVARLASAARGADLGALGWLQDQLPLIVMAWAACALALALRMGLGLMWIGRVAKVHAGNAQWQATLSAMALQCGVTRAVRLRVVDQLASPVTAGWWRPVVLVPAALVTGMPPELLEALLAHEMGHIRRFDYLVNLGQNVVEMLLFYHPAVWWISGRIRAERERIADDIAAVHLGDARRLARALSELEKLQFSGHHLAQAANGGDLMARIRRLVRPDAQALNWKAAIPVLGLAAACIAGCAQAPAEPKAAATIIPAVANFASCAKPLWPKESLRNEHQGTVTLAFKISTDGQVEESKLRKSSGYPLLDEAARVGIEKCRFRPATQGGQPVAAWMNMQYVWTLK